MSFIPDIIRFFEGRVRIYADGENKNALIDFFIDNGIETEIMGDGEKDGIYTEISPSLLKNIAPALDKLNIMVYIINIYGFGRLRSRYSKRYGLPIGALLMTVLLWLSTLFIWRVDVSGTELLSKEQIRAELSEMGVRVGARISDVDRAYVQSSFLKEHSELSWAALNFNGTTAELALKETVTPPPDSDSTARVLVASESGVVRSVTVYGGVLTVKPGAVVKKGDVLISGFISGSGSQITGEPPLRVTEARGSVKAEVTKRISVSVPFFEENECVTRGEKKTLVLSVLGLDIPLGKTKGKTAESERNITVFGFIEIPVTVKTFSVWETKKEIKKRDAAECRLTAERELFKRINEMLGDGELTYVKVEYTETDKGIEAAAEIGCVVEIAVPYKEWLTKE